MSNHLFSYGKEIIQQLNEHLFSAFFVGGCVRDFLLNRQIGDIDIVTDALPEEIREIFPKTIPLGVDHGTIIIRHQGISFEVSTFRCTERINIDDSLTHKEHIQKLLYNDLQHRDFTINAIAMDIKQTIIDPFNGQESLERGVIQGVHNDYDRLIEDPLRILRAFRFVSELGFTIDPQTSAQIKKVNKQLINVAIERITQEFTKLIKGTYVKKSLQQMIATKTNEFIPVSEKTQKAFTQLAQIIKPLQSLSEFFVLLNQLNDQLSIKNIINTWKCSRKTYQEAFHLQKAINYFDQNGLDRWLVYQLGEDYFDNFLRVLQIISPNNQLTLSHLEHIYGKLAIYSVKDIVFTGYDLKMMFPQLQPGLWMKQMLAEIEKQIVTNQLENDYKMIKEWVLCHPPEVD